MAPDLGHDDSPKWQQTFQSYAIAIGISARISGCPLSGRAMALVHGGQGPLQGTQSWIDAIDET
jgi:hypothetical protein